MKSSTSELGLTLMSNVESVNALPKVVGFLRVLRFPPTGNVDGSGCDKLQTSSMYLPDRTAVHKRFRRNSKVSYAECKLEVRQRVNLQCSIFTT